MNDLNPREKQLRSWNPRRPSARLKQLLFPDQSAADVSLELRHAWHWFAPAACVCVLMLFSLFGHARKAGYPGITGDSNMIASLALGGRNPTPYVAPHQIGERNFLSAETVDWAKASRILSTTGSFQLWKTNLHKL